MKEVDLFCDICHSKIGKAKIPEELKPNLDGTIPSFEHYCNICIDRGEK